MPKQERFRLGKFYLGKKANSPNWRINWVEDGEVTGFSTGTRDLEEAKAALAKHFIREVELKDERPDEVPLATLLDRYYEKRASKLASKDSAKSAVDKWKEFWGPATVADLTLDRQEKFIAWLEAYVPKRGATKGKAKLSRATISRQISTGVSAIRYALARHEIGSAPQIISYKHNVRRKRVLSIEEMKRLLNATKDLEHVRRWLLLAIGTAARPNAILELASTPPMLDLENGLIDLLPPEMEGEQEDKRRPIIPIAPTLLPLVKAWAAEGERLVMYRGKRVKKIRMGFNRVKARAGITDPKVVPVTVRHTMITWLIKRKVDGDQREIFIGHKLPGSETTAGYVHLEPDYCNEAVVAVEAYLQEVLR